MKVQIDVLVEGGMGQFVMPKYLEKFGYQDIIRLFPKGWSDIFEIALQTGKPEPYGKNSNFFFHHMSVPLQLVELMELRGELPGPDQPEKRRKVLQDELTKAVSCANQAMIGKITPQERMKRRILAVVFLYAVVKSDFF